ncbi:uncharacterized protein LOC143026327 [Oratosquilla oratoria]|uniref:uncharacterized protein LOC143026327 n=1 Tax=Oratosquilla oratoria TaxID=337810 RepID=UPI003F76AA82
MGSKEFLQPRPINGLEDLNKTWLEECLSSYHKTKVVVRTWHGKTPEVREGYLSELAYVDVDYTVGEDDEVNNGLVFKFLPQAETMLGIVKSSSLSEREIMFYKYAFSEGMRKIFQEIQIEFPVPEVLYSQITSSAMTLVMRNLRREGFECINPKEGLGLLELRESMKCVAVIHACGAIYERREGSESMEKLLNDPPLNLDFYVSFIKKGFIHLSKLYEGSRRAELFLQWSEKGEYLLELPKKNTIMRTCVSGDYWANNVMYNMSAGTAKILDWQLSHFGNPVQDIVIMLIVSANPSVLEDHMYEILGVYWDSYVSTLRKAGVTNEVTFSELLENVQRLWMYGLSILAASLEFFIANEAITEEHILAIVDFVEGTGVLDIPQDENNVESQ